MLIDDLFDRLVRRFRRSERQEFNEFSQNPRRSRTRPQRPGGDRTGHGFFNGASNFVVNQPTFTKNRTQIVQMFAAAKPVLELIAPHTDPNAAVDSSARFPPPSCHPGTRLKIGDKLFNWLTNPDRQWNMIWLHGPAGTGKSAVAQTFAERCVENGRLGASFFFSRPNNRNDPDSVIPSLVYQLAVHNPNYKSLITTQLANDPQLMFKARHIQFKRLIVEPFLQLQTQRRKRIREPLLIVLDGLDECKGENAQREIIEMISEAMRLRKDLPLLWLICSRPEAHLKYIFSRADYTVNCGREELVIDAESIADVDLYLQDGLVGIKTHFWDVTIPTWPSEEQSTKLLNKASGHFGFASTALRYIGDLTSAAPMARFDNLLSFLEGVKTGLSNPLEALDALYSGILCDIPDEALQIAKRILGYHVFIDILFSTAQVLCNFLHIDQATFYSALRKLHSVIDVPTPEAAFQTGLRFYHASFQDYLRDPSRSGKFIIPGDAQLDLVKMCLSWYKTDIELFHTTDGLTFNETHEHGILPGLKWVPDGNEAEISSEIASTSQNCWWVSSNAEWDEALLSQVRNFDFGYIRQDNLSNDWSDFVNRLWEVDSSSDVVRTEPRSEVDLRLLEYMKAMTKSGGPVKPAKFPLQFLAYGDYFLLGYGSTAVVCWTTGRRKRPFVILNCDEAPSKERVDAYQALFEEEEGSDYGDDEEEGRDYSDDEEEDSDDNNGEEEDNNDNTT